MEATSPLLLEKIQQDGQALVQTQLNSSTMSNLDIPTPLQRAKDIRSDHSNDTNTLGFQMRLQTESTFTSDPQESCKDLNNQNMSTTTSLPDMDNTTCNDQLEQSSKKIAKQKTTSTKETCVSPKKTRQIPFRHLIFNPRVDSQTLLKHLSLVYKGTLYATTKLRPPSDSYVESLKVELPLLVEPRKTLVLDLDETLIHSCRPQDRPDITISLKSSSSASGYDKIAVKYRPFLHQFLRTMSEHYEIVIFTASVHEYAKAIMDQVDPYQQWYTELISRQSCMETKHGFSIKDLRILGNRNLKDIIIVDNWVHSFGFQLENGVPILEFVGDETDQELKYMTDYLIKAAQAEDVREFNAKNLRLRDMAKIKGEEWVSYFVSSPVLVK
jgi:CTD small phosphatase-like protein 2